MKRTERDAQRLALLREGLTVPEIAERTGKTRSAIYVWIKKIDRDAIYPTSAPRTRAQKARDQKHAQRRERYDLGHTDRQIAEAEGTSAQTIWQWRLSHDLPPNDGPRKEQAARNVERNAQILAARAEGLTLTEIGARFGLCRERVRQLLDRPDAPVVSVKALRRRKTEERYARFHPLYEEGRDDGEIAQICGCSRSTVSAWRYQNNLPTRTVQGGDQDLRERNEALIQDKERGMTIRALSEKYQISHVAVCNILIQTRGGRDRERNNQIRRLLHEEGQPVADLMERFGLSRNRLRQIAGPRWAWIAANPPAPKETP